MEGRHRRGKLAGYTWVAIITVVVFVAILCYIFGTNNVIEWIFPDEN